jgi:hypothetical protein
MSGRDKAEMVHRAQFVVETLAIFGIRGISPVLEEGVKAESTKLINYDKEQVRGFWARDKYIIRYISHAVLFDHAEMTSLGMTREYCLNRGVLWRPTAVLLEKGTPTSVAQWEDDLLGYSVHMMAAEMSRRWGSRYRRITWRLTMISRSLPKWVLGQLYGFR